MLEVFAGSRVPVIFYCMYLHDLSNLPQELFLEQVMRFHTMKSHLLP